jgi:glycosyltransferase involved in cell wall biosynthesis
VRVLFVIDTWGLIGGTERHAAVVVPALLERGHRVDVLCRADLAPGFAQVDVRAMPELSGPSLPRAARRELARTLRERAPDVVFHSALRNVDAAEVLVDSAPVVRYVHDHTLFCPGLNKYREDGETCREPLGWPCMRSYWLGSGCTCFKPAGHAHRLLDPLRELHRKWRELDIARRSAHVLTNSRYMQDELLQVGFAPERTSVLYYFTLSNTPYQPRGPLPPRTADFLASTSGPLLFTPARLTLPDKGVDYLLTALARVRAPFRAVIAGAGPAEAWLREKARAEGLEERVHFSGWTDAGGIETLYSRADVVVCPSVWDEPFGLVGLEAMAHAKPVVAFRVGGIPEWISDGETGLSVPRKDTAAMAAAIERLLADPDEALRLGAEGRRRAAERFGRERHVERLEAVLSAGAGLSALGAAH